jgi:hypothetical protein
VPQGTLAERLRAGGAGIPGFYTPAGVGTQVADGGLPWRYDGSGGIAVASPKKETREFDGRAYVLEEGIVCDFALVHAWKGDRHGNLVYRMSARNFNPMVATAGRITIAEVEEIVEPGELEAADIHTPGVFVQRVVRATVDDSGSNAVPSGSARTRTPVPAPARRWGPDGAHPRGARRPGRARARGRPVRQPRHRPADPGAPTTCRTASTSRCRARTASSAWVPIRTPARRTPT